LTYHFNFLNLAKPALPKLASNYPLPSNNHPMLLKGIRHHKICFQLLMDQFGAEQEDAEELLIQTAALELKNPSRKTIGQRYSNWGISCYNEDTLQK
jgi:hypothetical protein